MKEKTHQTSIQKPHQKTLVMCYWLVVFQLILVTFFFLVIHSFRLVCSIFDSIKIKAKINSKTIVCKTVTLFLKSIYMKFFYYNIITNFKFYLVDVPLDISQLLQEVLKLVIQFVNAFAELIKNIVFSNMEVNILVTCCICDVLKIVTPYNHKVLS